MRTSTVSLFVGAVLGLHTHAVRLDAQHPVLAKQTTRDTRAYSSNPADFVPGRRVYLRSTKTPIGTIIATHPNKSFPRSFPRLHMKAVLIARAGGADWVPLEGITRIYVTR